MCSHEPGLLTRTIPAIVIPRKTSSETRRCVSVVMGGHLTTDYTDNKSDFKSGSSVVNSRLYIFFDHERRNVRRHEGYVVIRTQEHAEVVLSFEDLFNAIGDGYHVAVDKIGELTRKLLARFTAIVIRKQQHVKLRLLQFVEDALPVDYEVRQSIARFHVV